MKQLRPRHLARALKATLNASLHSQRVRDGPCTDKTALGMKFKGDKVGREHCIGQGCLISGRWQLCLLGSSSVHAAAAASSQRNGAAARLAFLPTRPALWSQPATCLPIPFHRPTPSLQVTSTCTTFWNNCGHDWEEIKFEGGTAYMAAEYLKPCN